MAGVGGGRRPVLGYQLAARMHVLLYVWICTRLDYLSRIDRDNQTGLAFSAARYLELVIS